MVDLVSVTEEKFVPIVEAKRSSLGEAMKQCLLAMKDMRKNNGGGTVWICYNGRKLANVELRWCLFS